MSRSSTKQYCFQIMNILTKTILALGLMLGSSMALAQNFALPQTYFVPIPEGQVHEVLDTLDPGDSSETIQTVISITPSFNDTIIVYDQWENGYEADLSNPSDVYSAGNPGGTQIWGDDDPSNGIPPGFASDIINVGDVILLENVIDTTAAVDPDAPLFNGRDKFAGSRPLAVTRAAWATPDPGTLLAGAVEVYPTSEWGTIFESPVGENLGSLPTPVEDDNMFELVTATYMAAEDNTKVELDVDNDGATDLDFILDQGESFLVDVNASFPVGSKATSNKPLQLHALTGDIGATYESRWAVVFPLDSWTDQYFVPVSTDTADPTDVFVYNPDPNSAITVKWETEAGLQPGDINVPARGVARVRIPNDSGARFFHH